MIEVLAGISGTSTLALIAVVVWLVYKSFAAKDAQVATLGELDKEREETRTVRGQLALEEQRSEALAAQLKTEQDLRAVVEARLSLAQRRVTDLLKSHLERASDEEIRAATAAAFGGFASDGVPLSETEDGRLLRPGEDADVPPAGTP